MIPEDKPDIDENNRYRYPPDYSFPYHEEEVEE